MKARIAILGLAFLLIAGPLAILVPPPARGLDLSGLQGGDLRVALQGFGGLDPRTASLADRRVLELLYDSLGRVDPDTLEVLPWAAANWEWDGDTNLTVTLRDDLRFSDGSPYDADDVARSLAQYQSGGISRWRIFVRDERTLQFDFHRTTVQPVSLGIVDNDVATIFVTPLEVTATEGGATGAYAVVLASRRPTGNVTFTAAPSAQAAVSPRSLVFGPTNWTDPQTVIVAAVNDTDSEGDHIATITHTVSSADAAYNGLSVPDVSVRITDDDVGTVVVAPSEVFAAEGAAPASYSIVLAQRVPTLEVVISLGIPSGNATASPLNLTFGPTNWTVPQVVTVDVADDAIVEGDHSVPINHTLVSGDPEYDGIQAPEIDVRIQDNDLAGASVRPIIVSTEEGGATAAYTIALWRAPTASVTVTPSPGADVVVSPPSLIFTTGNWATPQPVTVTAVQDAFAERDHADTIQHVVTSPDPTYNGLAISDVTARISDDDAAGVIATPSLVRVVEGGSTDTYTLVLSRAPLADVTISVSTDGELTASPNTLTFTTANWATPRPVVVAAVDDSTLEWGHTSDVVHDAQSADPAYDVVSIPSVTTIVQDNDESGVTVTPTNLDLAEGGGSETFSVVLWRGPASDVTVTFAPNPNVAFVPASVTFTTGNWATAQSITVTATDDLLREGLHTVPLNGTSRSADADYDSISPNRRGAGFFWTEALTASLAWDASGTRKYTGPFAVRQPESTNFVQDPDPADGTPDGMLVLEPQPHHFSDDPHLDSVTYKWPYTAALVAVQVGNDTEYYSAPDDAGCALMFRDVHFIGWPLLSTDLTNQRDCVANWGGFPGRPAGYRESLLSADATRFAPHTLTVKNSGTDLLYFGFTFNGNSMFSGGPESEGQRLRSAIYWFVNKANAANIAGAGSTRIAHGPINSLDAPWAPPSCDPWTPCDTIVDAGFTGAGQTTGTNTARGKLELALGGFFDRDGDGTLQLSTGAPIDFRLIAPRFGVDARTTIAEDLAGSLRGAGLAVTLDTYNATATWEAAIASCKTSGSCMYLARYADATQSPDWLYAMPEIGAAMDERVDANLTAAGNCYEISCRRLQTGRAGHLVGSGAVFLPVLHYEVLEAYDFMTFEGWADQFGGVNNPWTFAGLRMPTLGALSARVTIAPTQSVLAGETTQVLVTVQDASGLPVGNASVELTLSPANGTLSLPTGLTDGVGVFRTEYTAPGSVMRRTDVWIGASVAKRQYGGASAAASLTVHPAQEALLQIAVSRPKLEINASETTQVTVQVRDANGDAVPGAEVNLRTNLPGATITPASGTTDTLGLFQATFRADVQQGMRYQIFADVTADGFAEDTASAVLIVRSDFTEPIPEIPVTRNVPGFEALYALGAIALALALVALRRRRE